MLHVAGKYLHIAAYHLHVANMLLLQAEGYIGCMTLVAGFYSCCKLKVVMIIFWRLQID
jgi:hypothetical protein